MGKSKKAVLFYKKLETQELTVEEKEEKARKDKKLRELHQQALEDKFRQPGFIYRDQDVKNNRRYIESEGMINRRFMQHESAVYGCHVTMDQKYLVSYAADGYVSSRFRFVVSNNSLSASDCGISIRQNSCFIRRIRLKQ